MRYKFDGIYRDGNGKVVPNGTVSVFLAGTGTAAHIYTTLAGATPASSVTSDATDGTFVFYVDALEYGTSQTYDIVLSKTNYDSKTYTSIKLEPVPGTYTISTNTTATYPVSVPYGVTYSIDTGVTLTINGSFSAGLYQVFSGAGSVAFGTGAVSEAYPEWWGAKGDGITDDTSAVQAALNSGASVIVLTKTYGVSSVTVPNGVHIIRGPGTLKCIAWTVSGVLLLDGDYVVSTTTPVTDLTISGITVDGNSINNVGIWGFGNNARVNITGNIVKGLIETHGGIGGIRLYPGSHECSIIDNKIYNPVGITASMGIMLNGGVTDIYYGYFTNLDGTVTAATDPIYDCIVQGNLVYNGTHGIVHTGVNYCNTVGNVCIGQTHRSIALYLATHCNITGNSCQEFGSSGVIMAYGSEYNEVSGNNCISSLGGEGGIQAYVACAYNHIVGNKVKCSGHYGIYIAIGSSFNTVSSNDILGFSCAGIGLEADWQEVNPVGATYSRPNYGAPPAGAKWAYTNCLENVIVNNVIRKGNGSSIYLAATNGPSGVMSGQLVKTAIKGNVCVSNATLYNLYIYEETLTGAGRSYITGNTFEHRSRIYFSNSYYQTNELNGNSFLDFQPTTPDDTPFVDGDTTPSVSYAKYYTCVNTNPTAITNFDNGQSHQEIVVRLDTNTDIVHAAANIRLLGGKNITGRNSNDFVCFRNLGNIWMEQWRSW